MQRKVKGIACIPLSDYMLGDCSEEEKLRLGKVK
jgi:hypothetical protein